MTTTLMILQAILSILLIIVVLLQFGKGAEAGLMSSGGADSVFTGAQTGNILSKITVVLSILFMGNSILMSKVQSTKGQESKLDNVAPISKPLNSDVTNKAQEESAQPKNNAEKTTTPETK